MLAPAYAHIDQFLKQSEPSKFVYCDVYTHLLTISVHKIKLVQY